MSRLGWLISVLIVCLLGGLGYWLSQTLEKKEIELPTGLQGEAATNPLLAAQRFLTKTGITSSNVDETARLFRDLGPGDALLISSDRQTLGQQRTATLLDWVYDGGRLIVTIPHLLKEEQPFQDSLLERLGLTVHYYDGDISEYADYLDVDWPGATDFMRIAIHPRYFFDGAQADDRTINNDWGPVLVRRQYGHGIITVITDLDFIQFLQIGEYDHAAFLWYLVDGQGPVWLLSHNDMPSLWQWLWQHAPEIMTATLLWLVLWLWSRGRRFGPRLAEAAPIRRRIIEHVDANGRFLWQQKQSRQLLSAVRNHLMTVVAKHHPGWGAMSSNEQTDLLARLSQNDSDSIRHLLAETSIQYQHEFTRTIRQLEMIRKKL
jgi:hypothetical protein